MMTTNSTAAKKNGYEFYMSEQENKHEIFEKYLHNVEADSVFVEIGSENGEGSTNYLSQLAKAHNSRLISVDITSPQYKQQAAISFKWQEFYNDIRDQTWPSSVSSIDQLPEHIRHECETVHTWSYFQQQQSERFKFLDDKNNVIVQDIGSRWSQNYGATCGQPISLLYLDNFDYIWEVSMVFPDIQEQITMYRDWHGIDMNNQNCQVEHLTQLINLYPFLAKNCLVGFDDTYRMNDCWVGKSGPGVVYLLSQGWHIVHCSGYFVIMSNG